MSLVDEIVKFVSEAKAASVEEFGSKLDTVNIFLREQARVKEEVEKLRQVNDEKMRACFDQMRSQLQVFTNIPIYAHNYNNIISFFPMNISGGPAQRSAP